MPDEMCHIFIFFSYENAGYAKTNDRKHPKNMENRFTVSDKISFEIRPTDGLEVIMEKNMTNGEIPLGLGMAFAQNTAAMERFAAMSEQERQNIISMAQNVGSKAEMAAFVQKIADGHAANS